MSDAVVPCAGCTLCCKQEIIQLHPECGDDPADYGDNVREGLPGYPGEALMLKHKPNGDCIYLGEAGCTIYDKRPVICREFDCRRAAVKIQQAFTRAVRRQMAKTGALDSVVYKRGIELLRRSEADEVSALLADVLAEKN